MTIRREIGFLARWLQGGFDPEEWIPGLPVNQGRVTLHISSMHGHRQEMDLQAALVKLRRLQSCCDTWISLDSIYWDPSALLVDITSYDVTHIIWPLCDELVTLSKSLLLIRTISSKEAWQQKMEAVYQR